VGELLDVARDVLDPVRGTLILRLAEQVRLGTRKLQPFRVVQLAEAQGWTVCDAYVLAGASMPDAERPHSHHLPSPVYWLVLHPSPRCPGEGVVPPLRTRCAHCGRPVAVEKMHTPTYCRPPSGCKQAAYRERLRQAKRVAHDRR
jgi:hypothetical protein